MAAIGYHRTDKNRQYETTVGTNLPSDVQRYERGTRSKTLELENLTNLIISEVMV